LLEAEPDATAKDVPMKTTDKKTSRKAVMCFIFFALFGWCRENIAKPFNVCKGFRGLFYRSSQTVILTIWRTADKLYEDITGSKVFSDH
jgi:hypothetical protein